MVNVLNWFPMHLTYSDLNPSGFPGEASPFLEDRPSFLGLPHTVVSLSIEHHAIQIDYGLVLHNEGLT